MNNKYYNENLKHYARENRKSPTKAESYIWNNLLRRKKCFGLKFLRQRPVSKYIVDFMCLEINLIIEIDGLSHSFENVSKKDKIREKELKNLGFIVLRFEDNEVLNDFDNVVRVIDKFLIENELITIK